MEGLDGLRGIAAIVIALFHFGPTRPFFAAGDLAVDLFFAISGYVMARTYEQRLRSRDLGALRFVALRIARLWPIFAVGTLLGGLYFLVAGAALAPLVVSTAFVLAFLPSPLPIGRHLFNPNGPGWSILFELVANAIHAVWLCRAHDRFLFCIWVVCVSLAFAGIARFGFIPSGGHWELMPWVVPRVLAGYIAGILVYRHSIRISIRPWIALTSVPLLLAGGGLVPGFAYGFILLCPLLVAAMARPVESPILRRFGTLSYPLYAIHVPMMNMFGFVGLMFAPFAAYGLGVADGLRRHRRKGRQGRQGVTNQP